MELLQTTYTFDAEVKGEHYSVIVTHTDMTGTHDVIVYNDDGDQILAIPKELEKEIKYEFPEAYLNM